MFANLRAFEAGPDPYGRTWEVSLLWLQTAVSIRHSDSVDVKFLLRSSWCLITQPGNFRNWLIPSAHWKSVRR